MCTLFTIKDSNCSAEHISMAIKLISDSLHSLIAESGSVEQLSQD